MKDLINFTKGIKDIVRARALILALVMTLAMVAATALQTSNYAYAAGNFAYAEPTAYSGSGDVTIGVDDRTAVVATFDQLKFALSIGGIDEIVIDPQAAEFLTDAVNEDGEKELVTYDNETPFYIAFDEPLTVSHDTTIRNADGIEVYFARSASFVIDQGNPALFNVDAKKTLNLEGLITMTGDEVIATFDEETSSFSFDVKTRDGEGEDNEAWDSSEVLPGGFYAQSNGGEINVGEDVILEEIYTTDDVEGVEPIVINEGKKSLLASLFGGNDEETVEEAIEEDANAEEANDEEANEEDANEEESEPVQAPKKSVKLAAPKAAPAQTLNTTATSEIDTWKKLQEAIKNAENGDTIIVAKSIVADSSEKYDDDSLSADGSLLLRGKELTIKGPDDKKVYIYRKSGDADFPLISVESGDNLTLGENLVLTGKSENCVATTVKEFNVILSNGLTGNDEYTEAGGPYAAGTELIFTPSTNMLNSAPGSNYEFVGWQWVDWNGDIGSSENNQNINVTGLSVPSDIYGTITFVAKWEKTSDAKDAYSSSQGAGEYYDNASAINWSTNTTQQCDGKCATYSTTANAANNVYKFSGGTAGKEKGFFAQVEGGQLVLDGATLEDFITDGTVAYTAPIVVNGSASGNKLSFEFKSGNIRHNSVGYSASNRDATYSKWNVSGPAEWQAQDIGLEAEIGNFEESEGSALAKWANTETAGAIILTNGAKAEMSGGLIDENRGDTGAIVVQGLPDNRNSTVNATKNGIKSTLKVTGGTINNNVGIHHAGAMYVYNGGSVQLGEKDKVNNNNDEIKITNNFAWNKGGAIWASEEVYASGYFKKTPLEGGQASNIPVGEAAFVMYSGTIDNNMAVERGGGIEVMSNHVALIGGNITNNTSRVLGGGIYVEGDPGKMYRLYIENGGITDNYAVNPDSKNSANTQQAKRIQRIFNLDESDPADPCNFKNNILMEDSDHHGDYTSQGNLGYRTGFWGAYGNGGGIWLCSFGGNTTLAIKDGADVVIDGNHKENGIDGRDIGHGEDIFISAQGQGGNGILILDQGRNNFVEEGTNNGLTQGKNYAGKLFLENASNPQLEWQKGVNISGNVASCGGGIAANGTVLFGKESDMYRASTTLKIKKEWKDGLNNNGNGNTEIMLKLQLLDNNGNPVVVKDDDPLEGYEVILNGITDEYVNSSSDLGPNQYGPNSITRESAAYEAEMGLPLTAIDNEGNTVPIVVFEIDSNGDGVKDKILDPSNHEDLKFIHNELEKSKDFWDNAYLVVRLKVTEYVKNGDKWEEKEVDEIITPFEIDRDGTQNVSKVSTNYTDIDGNPVGSFSVYTTNFVMKHGIANRGDEVEIKKVNTDGDLLNGGTFKLFRAKLYGTTPDYIVDTDFESQTLHAENGILRFRTMGDGAAKYLLFEEAAPKGHVTEIDPWLIDVNADGEVEGIYKNTENPGTCWIFDKSDGHRELVMPEGGYTKDNLSTPLHKWPKPWFERSDSRVENLVNEWKPWKFKKVSAQDSSKTLSGVEFSMIKIGNANDCADKGYEEDWSGWSKDLANTTANGSKQVGTQVTSNGNGEFIFNVPGPGWYFIFEDNVPAGYVDNTKRPWLLVVNSDGSYQLRRHNGNTADESGNKNGKDWWTAKNFEFVGKDCDLVLENEPKPIELTKIDDTADKNALGGAEFVLTQANTDDIGWYIIEGRLVKDSTLMTASAAKFGGTAKTVTSASDGKIKIEDLEAGTYFLFETKAPTGFRRVTSPWLIRVTDDANGRTWNVYALRDEYKNKAYMTGTDGNKTAVEVADGDTSGYQRWWPQSWFDTSKSVDEIVNQMKYITKVDSTTVNKTDPITLANVEFDLYPAFIQNISGYDYIRQGDEKYKIATLKSDANGRIEIPSSITSKATAEAVLSDSNYSNMRTNGYMLVEKEAPAGYEMPTAPWWITVDSNGVISVKTTTAAKKSIKTNNPEGIPAWYLSNYTSSYKVDYGQKITNKPSSLELYKVDGYTQKGLGGAVFKFTHLEYSSYKNSKYYYKLLDDAKSTVLEPSQAGTGKILIPNWGYGEAYLLEEITAPDNYQLPTDDNNKWIVVNYYNSGSPYAYVYKYHYESGYYYISGAGSSNPDCLGYNIPNYPSVNLKKVNVDSVDLTVDNGSEVITYGTETVEFLEGVKFQLFKSNSNWTKDSNTPVDVKGSDSEKKIATNADGILDLGTLANNTRYLLYETDAKEGYIKQTAPWRIEIGNDGKIANLWIPTDVDGKTYMKTDHKTYLTNCKIYDLPHSGGIGTYWFSVIGSMMMGFGVTTLIVRRRKANNKL